MNLHGDIEPFRAAIEALQRLLEKFDHRGVIIGGIAVGFLGRPRLTEDVDAMFLLSTQEIPGFLKAAKNEGIEPRIPGPPLERILCAVGSETPQNPVFFSLPTITVERQILFQKPVEPPGIPSQSTQ